MTIWLRQNLLVRIMDLVNIHTWFTFYVSSPSVKLKCSVGPAAVTDHAICFHLRPSWTLFSWISSNTDVIADTHPSWFTSASVSSHLLPYHSFLRWIPHCVGLSKSIHSAVSYFLGFSFPEQGTTNWSPAGLLHRSQGVGRGQTH